VSIITTGFNYRYAFVMLIGAFKEVRLVTVNLRKHKQGKNASYPNYDVYEYLV